MSSKLSLAIEGPAQGPPVVLANALGTNAELWAAQIGPLSERFRVIRYEPVPRASVAELAADLTWALHEERFGRVSICGVSLGAMVAMEIAVSARDRVERLVLACTSARFGVASEWIERAREVRDQGIAKAAGDALEKWFTPAFQDRQPFLDMQLAVDPADYALGLQAIGDFDFRHRLDLDQIRAPTLVIAGASDTATTPADAALIAEGIRDARLVVIEQAAHLANVERPDDFNAAVIGHLAR